ncbi:hypothetical protein MY1884_007720 [Beauveria asiatica]
MFKIGLNTTFSFSRSPIATIKLPSSPSLFPDSPSTPAQQSLQLAYQFTLLRVTSIFLPLPEPMPSHRPIFSYANVAPLASSPSLSLEPACM